MKLIYIANIRLPTEKAHGIQIMKMCEAFALHGVEVELVVPRRLNPIKADPFSYYGVERNFKITRLSTIDLVQLGRIGFWIQALTFAESAFWYCLFKKADIIYSRDEWSLYYLSLWRSNTVWEVHTAHRSFLIKRLLKRCRAIVAISQGLKDFYIVRGVNPAKVLVAPDAVDLGQFAVAVSKEEARKKLGLPLDKKLIVYTGHLYSWKGADILAEAAKLIDGSVIFVGGTDNDIENFKMKYGYGENIQILGRKPHREIPLYLKSADVLVIPNSAKEDISKLYTSPMKLFEYMASGVPIVVSNLPSICEVLNEKNAVLVAPNNPAELAAGIKRVLENPGLAGKISRQASDDVKNHTWARRAKTILEFLQVKV